MFNTHTNQLLTTCQRQMGYIMLLTVMLLCVLGLITLFSIGGVFAPAGDPQMYRYATAQLKWLIIGGVACIVFSCLDYHVLLKYAPVAITLSIFLLLLCFVPGIGKTTNGSARWLTVAGIGLQPSEFAKIALILFLSFWMSSNYGCNREFVRGFLIPAAITAMIAGPVLKSPDLGTTVLLVLVFLCIMFSAGISPLYLATILGTVVSGILFMAISMPQRLGRLMAFMDPEAYKLDYGYQPWQGLIALGSGGLNGVGLGMSRQKMLYLPFCHTDFIFPIIGEEMGMWVALAVVAGYIIFAICGCWIAVHAPDNGGFYLGMGLTCLITLQALMNLCVVTSLMPNKGLPLPFISYGGSSLLFCLIAVGILFNLHRQGVAGETENGSIVLPDRMSPRM